MKTLNKIQLVVILAFVALGAYTFGSPYLIQKSGVAVVSVSNTKCQNVHPGDIITEAGGNQINNIQDFSSLNFAPNQFVSLVVNSGPGGCIALSDGSLGISATGISSSGIQFGVDLGGGKKYIVDTSNISSTQLQNISNILNARTIYLGLAGTKAEIENGNLVIVSGQKTNVNQLLFRGIFEGDVEEGVALQSNQGGFEMGSDNYTVQQIGSSYKINNGTYSVGDSFYLSGIKTTIVNNTNTSVIFYFTFLNNSDALGEVPGYQQTSVDSNGNYEFQTLISISPSSGKRFSQIIQNSKTTVVGTQINLDAVLIFNLDGNVLSGLGIPATLKGQNLANIYVVVVDPSKDSLLNKEALVRSVLHSGSLPSALSIVSSEDIKSTQTSNAFASLGIIIVALVVVPIVAGSKYKKLKHNSLSIVIGAAEVFAVLSVFVAFQVFSNINAVFDFAALVGLTLVALNWVINVLTINLSTHAQKDLSIKVGYRKLFSLSTFSKLLLILAAFVLAGFGYGTAGIIIFVGVVFDIIVFKSFYKSFVS